MLPLILGLTGFRGIRSGFGVDKKRFDFTSVPDGLIAFVGPNGKGKSTVLQNMHPYLIMPDEVKKYSPSAFSYYEECYGRTACKELQWLHYDGRVFKSLVQIDADKRKTKAYLYVNNIAVLDTQAPSLDQQIIAYGKTQNGIKEDATALFAEDLSLTSDTERLSYDTESQWEVSHNTDDGNVEAYNTAIESLLGSPRMFFTNIFRSQEAKKLSDYPKGEMMDYFAELLTIEEYKDRAWEAGYVEGALTAKRDAISAALVTTMVTVNKDRQTLQEKADIEKNLRDLALDIQAEETVLKGLQVELRDVDTQIALLQEAEKKRLQTEASISEKSKVIEDLRKSLTSKREFYDTKIASLQEKQKLQQSLVDKAPGLRLKVAEEATIAGDLVIAQREQSEADAAITANAVLLQEAVKKKAQIESSIMEKEKLLTELQQSLKDKKALYNSKHATVAVKIKSAKALITKDAALQAKVAEDLRLTTESEQISKEIEALDAQDISLNQQIAAFNVTRNTIAEREKTLQGLQLKRKGLADSLQTSITAKESLVANLTESGCTRPDKAASCRFVKDAYAAQESLPGLKASLVVTDKPAPQEIALSSEIEALRQTLVGAPAVEKQSKEVREQKVGIVRKQKETEAALKPVREALKELPLVEEAQRQLPELGKELASILEEGRSVITDIEKQIKQVENDVSGLKAELPKDTDTPPELLARKTVADARIAEKNKAIGLVRDMLKGLPLAEEAEKQLPELEKELVATSEECKIAIAEVETQVVAITAEVEKLKAEMPPPNADKELAAKKEDLDKSFRTAGNSIALKRDEDSRLKVLLGALSGTLATINEAKVRAASLEGMIDNLNLEISEWKVVEDRVDGIIPLEVDDVGPTLSAISNDLLLSCYGPRFTVKINTQDLMVNGKDLKETFEIMVYDAERNEIKPLRKMSPGERVWIEGTITTAGDLFNAGRSGQHFLARFTDEKDGALSDDKKLEYVAMKSKVLELGHFKKEYFISHNIPVQQRADSIINFN